MNSTPNSKASEPDDVLVARADERLAHAYAEIARADEQLARINEQLSKLDRDAARHPSAVLSRRPPRGRLRGLIGLLLAACIFGAAFVSQSSYGDAAKQIVSRWAPQGILASLPPLEKTGVSAQPGPSTVQLAAAEPVGMQPTPSSSTAPQDAGPAAAPMPPELAQLLRTMARDLANVEQGIEQLKASQEQTARENAKVAEQLKAGQEQVTRLIAKASETKVSETKAPEQNQRSKPSAPPPGPVTASTRKPVPPLPSSQARAQPRAPTQLQPREQ